MRLIPEGYTYPFSQMEYLYKDPTYAQKVAWYLHPFAPRVFGDIPPELFGQMVQNHAIEVIEQTARVIAPTKAVYKANIDDVYRMGIQKYGRDGKRVLNEWKRKMNELGPLMIGSREWLFGNNRRSLFAHNEWAS